MMMMTLFLSLVKSCGLFCLERERKKEKHLTAAKNLLCAAKTLKEKKKKKSTKRERERGRGGAKDILVFIPSREHLFFVRCVLLLLLLYSRSQSSLAVVTVYTLLL